MLKKFVVVVILGISFLQANAQKGWEVGGWLGTSFYNGDLNNTINLRSPGLAGGLLGKYNYNSRVAWRASFNYGRISADDAKSNNNFQRNRNLSFYSDIVDFTTGIEFNFLEHVRGSEFKTYTPFVVAGFSVFHFNPKTELNGEVYQLRNYGTEGQDIGEEYFTINAGLMIGGGFKWDISDELTLTAEFTTRRVFTDYLDDVSTVYPDFNRLTVIRGEEAVALSNRSLVDGIGVEGRQRGNSKSKDSYTFISLSLTKYFGRLECPKISKI